MPALDGKSGTTYPGGWWNGNYKQMGTQLAAATVCAAWSFTISCILLFIINRIPGCHIRCEDEDEIRGLDAKYFSDVDSEMLAMMGLSAGSGESGGSSLRHGGRTGVIQGEEPVVVGEKTVTKAD